MQAIRRGERAFRGEVRALRRSLRSFGSDVRAVGQDKERIRTKMQRRESASALDQARTILTVDDARSVGDDFKLSVGLRGLLESRRATLEQAETNLRLVSGGRVNAATRLKDSRATLAGLLRDGYNHIRAIPSYEIDPEVRLGAFIAYGWDNGKLGDLNDDTLLLTLARQALRATPDVKPAQARYPVPLLDRLEAALSAYTEASALAKIGTRQTATRTRDTAMDALEKTLARVRFFYCQASDETDKTAELARIDFQPRRSSGQRSTAAEKVAPPDGPLPPIPAPPSAG
jgi:hypothetical protein